MKLEETKTHSIHLRLTDEQYLFALNLGETMGLSVPDALRVLINTNLVASKKAREIQEKIVSDSANQNFNKDDIKAVLGDLYANDSNNQ